MPLTVPAATAPSPPPRREAGALPRSRMPSITTPAAWAASAVSPLLKSPPLPPRWLRRLPTPRLRPSRDSLFLPPPLPQPFRSAASRPRIMSVSPATWSPNRPRLQPLQRQAGAQHPPATYSCSATGPRTLYAWARDAAGNVSASRSASNPTVSGPGPPVIDGAALYASNCCQIGHGASRLLRPRSVQPLDRSRAQSTPTSAVWAA